MGLKDFIKKKNDLAQGQAHDAATVQKVNNAPEFTFIRSDTSTQEEIQPPSIRSTNESLLAAEAPPASSRSRRSLDVFRSSRSRSASASPQTSPRGESRRLSQRLHLSRAPPSSERVPENMPDIPSAAGDPKDKDSAELQWEKRATMLATQNERAKSRPSSPVPTDEMAGLGFGVGRTSPPRAKNVAAKDIEDAIQEAIRLHEAGEFARSTRIFGDLADPDGANNPLSQVLYGLSLRHGWGCEADTTKAIKYLTAAASNAASIEQLALQAGLKKGGAAKGELVLAIFELANCFRHGWGIEKDAYAAKQYYETAANLGDSDAMNEVAWCYLEGFGCKKDKFAAARYYRLAEKAGNKTLGNTWIWKDKYDPPGEGLVTGKKKK